MSTSFLPVAVLPRLKAVYFREHQPGLKTRVDARMTQTNDTELHRARATLARNLAAVIAREQLTQAQISERSGVSERMIQYVLGATSAASVDTLAALAHALGARIAEFVGEDSPPKDTQVAYDVDTQAFISQTRARVASNIAEAITSRGIARSRVASDAGVSRSMLYDVLGEKRAATIDFLVRLSPVLRLELEDFFKQP